jgi:dynein assembly factor 5
MEQSPLVASLQRDCHALGDSDRNVRRKALEALTSKLLPPDQAAASPHELQVCDAQLPAVCAPAPASASSLTLTLVAAAHCVQDACVALTPLLAQALADPADKCRERAAALVRGLVLRLAEPGPLLAAALPVLARRAVVPSAEAEPVEEIRLEHVAVLAAALESPGGAAAARKLVASATVLLCGAVRDPFSDLARAGCACTVTLARCVAPDAESAAHAVPALVDALCQPGGALTHRHAAVRGAGLAALDALIHAGGQPGETMLRAVPPCRALVQDASPGVRSVLLQAAATWLASPALVPDPDAPHVMSLLLLGCTDDAADVARTALDGLDMAACSRLAHSMTESHSAASVWLPPAFSRRPSSSCRALVTPQLPALVPAALADLKGWSPALRATGARLLLACLVCAEGGSDDVLGVVVPALVAAVADSSPEQAARVVAIVHAVGTHTRPSLWLPLVTDAVAGSEQAVSHPRRANALVVLSALLHSCGMQLTPDDIRQVAWALTCAPLVESATQHGAVRMQAAVAVATLVQTLLRTCGEPAAALAPVAPTLFATLLTLRTRVSMDGLAEEDASVGLAIDGQQSHADPASDTADIGLHHLDVATGGALYASQAGAFLHALAPEASTWRSPTCRGFLALCALLRTAPPHALAPHAATLAHILAACCASALRLAKEGDLNAGALGLAALRALDATLESAPHAAALAPACPSLLRDSLVPNLVWRAGRTAAATRYAALVACGTLLRSGAMEAAQLEQVLATTSLVTSLCGCLDDDYYVDMRLGAAHVTDLCLRACGPAWLPAHRLLVFNELIKRLDDSRDDVRVASAQVLTTFVIRALHPLFPTATAAVSASIDDVTPWAATHLPRLLACLTLHMDDNQATVRAAAAEAALAAASLMPADAARSLTAAQAAARHTDAYEAVLNRIAC